MPAASPDQLRPQAETGVLDTITVTGKTSDEVPARGASPPAKLPQLDTIVVTAQKVEQDLLEVPLSVAVMGGDQMMNADIQSADDAARSFGNVYISAQHGLVPYIYIRGIGTGDSLGFEQSVGTFVDGIYLGRSQFLLGALFDVERIEVIRGPQGALLGKNAIGGAINLTTIQPGTELESVAELQYGTFNRRQVQGGLSIPFSADWAARLAFFADERGAYLRNTGPGTDGESHRQEQWRATLAWRPPGNWSGVLTAEGGDVRIGGEVYQLSAATPESLLFYRLYDADTEADANDFQTSTDLDNQHSQRNGANARLRLDYSIEDATLSLLSAVADSDYDFLLDGDFSSIPLLSYGSLEAYEMQSHELRATGYWGDFSYLAGAYLLDQDLAVDTAFTFLPEGAGALASLELIPAALSNSLQTLLTDALTDRSLKTFRQRTRHKSVFAQSHWDFLPRWRATASLRWTHERKALHMTNRFTATGAPWVLLLGEEQYEAFLTRTEEDLSPAASLQYELTPDAWLYATYGTGFKGGGFNDLAPREDVLEFEGERSAGVEAGLKAYLSNRSLAIGLSAFRTRYEDLQVLIYNGQFAFAANAASARIQGSEFDLRWLPTQAFQLTASVGYLQATYQSFPNGPAPAEAGALLGIGPASQDLSGRPLSRAPRWSGSAGFEFTPRSFGPLNVTLGADTYFRDDMYLSTDLDPIDDQPAYVQLDARIHFFDDAQTFRLSLFGHNLTNELIRIESGDVPIFSGNHVVRVEPERAYGVAISLRW